ncbi:MAG: restriction endonuclease [Polyangiaceae bacterium]|nr:restriction endonuclease [Polyangiaceae bacterium]
MAIPTYDMFIPTLLQVLAAHPDGLRSRDAYEKVADAAKLSDTERAQLVPSGVQPVYQNRIGWAHDRLKRARYSQSQPRGFWRLTEAGRAFAAAHPMGLDVQTLDALAAVPRTSNVANAGEAAKKIEMIARPVEPKSPEERIDEAIEELNESLSQDLLTTIADASPTFFERLVLDLLLAMGYGASRTDLQQVGGSGDTGIDGIIALDRLGLEKVYVQAKRWKANVGRPEIQGFYGALAGRRARKGVFITTSDFTREAKEYAQSVSDSIVLVDGTTLAALMIERGVGVSHRALKIARLDGDYFEDA